PGERRSGKHHRRSNEKEQGFHACASHADLRCHFPAIRYTLQWAARSLCASRRPVHSTTRNAKMHGQRAQRAGSLHPAAAAPLAALLQPGNLPVRPDQRLRLGAPERARLLRFERFRMVVVRRVVEHRLRPQATAYFALGDQHGEQCHGYALPAARMARFTATRASCTLYLLPLSGRAPSTAASPAFAALSALMVWPASARSAPTARHGTGATWPRTMRASRTVPPSMRSATAAAASGQSSACFSRTS